MTLRAIAAMSVAATIAVAFAAWLALAGGPLHPQCWSFATAHGRLPGPAEISCDALAPSEAPAP